LCFEGSKLEDRSERFLGIKMDVLSCLIEKWEEMEEISFGGFSCILVEIISKYYYILDGSSVLDFLMKEENIEVFFKVFLN
jgi:hypothetical protein